MVDWHTHPEGNGDFSEGDVKHINDIMERFGHKDVYFVVYMPSQNKTYWYKAQPFKKK